MEWQKVDKEIEALKEDKKGKIRKNLAFEKKACKDFEKLVGNKNFNAALEILMKKYIEFKNT